MKSPFLAAGFPLAERQSSERWPLHSDPDRKRGDEPTPNGTFKEGTGMYPETEIRYD